MARKRSTIRLEGMDDLEAALKRLSLDTQGEVLRAAVDKGAEVVREVASQLAPRSTRGSRKHDPGHLSRNIKKERQWTRTQDTATTHVGMDKSAYYGRFQELGTVYEPAQPFMRPALDETKGAVTVSIGEHLRKAILHNLS